MSDITQDFIFLQECNRTHQILGFISSSCHICYGWSQQGWQRSCCKHLQGAHGIVLVSLMTDGFTMVKLKHQRICAYFCDAPVLQILQHIKGLNTTTVRTRHLVFYHCRRSIHRTNWKLSVNLCRISSCQWFQWAFPLEIHTPSVEDLS